jgi:hypothetical protein
MKEWKDALYCHHYLPLPLKAIVLINSCISYKLAMILTHHIITHTTCTKRCVHQMQRLEVLFKDFIEIPHMWFRNNTISKLGEIERYALIK